MRLTEEMIQEDDTRFKMHNLLAEFYYCGKDVPKRTSITNDNIRFYAWLCRSAYTLLKEQQPKTVLDIADSIEGIEVGKCPRCERTILNKKSDPTWFCKYCGQKVKWE